MRETASPLRRRIVLAALWLAVAGLVYLFDAGVLQEPRTTLASETPSAEATPLP